MSDLTPPTDTDTDTDTDLRRPRIRTGAVLWGLVLVAAAATALWVLATPGRREGAVDAILSLDGFGWTVAALVATGGILTLVALAAVIRSLQVRRR